MAIPTAHLPFARVLAAEAGWPATCAEPACRASDKCRGKLRPFGEDGPRYPACCLLAARGFHDARNLTVAEAELYFSRLFPGEGIGLVPARLDDPLVAEIDPFDEARDAMIEHSADRPANASEFLLWTLMQTPRSVLAQGGGNTPKP